MSISWLDTLDTAPEVPSSKQKKGAAHARYKAITEVKHLLKRLTWYVPYDILQLTGLSPDMLNKAREDFNKQTLLQSKTFTVCPTCYAALKPRAAKLNKPPKAGYSPFACNLCQAETYSKVTYTWTNRKIRHSLTLADTQVWIRAEHPELFI